MAAADTQARLAVTQDLVDRAEVQVVVQKLEELQVLGTYLATTAAILPALMGVLAVDV